MEQGKKIYFIALVIIVFLLSTVCFSYAFFTNINEKHGKLNIVAGTLNYKLESNDLENNQITVDAYTLEELTIALTSLNDINSKYQLYYNVDNESDSNNVKIGYDVDSQDKTLGTIKANETKTIKVIIRNESSNNVLIDFGVVGGFENNNLVLSGDKSSLNQVIEKYAVYSIGDKIELTDGSKWHVLEDSDEDSATVVLLSDYNLNPDGSYNTTCIGACNTMVFSSTTNEYDEEDPNNIGYFIKYTYAPLVTKVLPGTTNITLPTAEQIANADGQTFAPNQTETISLNTSWLINTRYYTKTPYFDDFENVWAVNDHYRQLEYYYAYYGYDYDARPVITTLKTNIL